MSAKEEIRKGCSIRVLNMNKGGNNSNGLRKMKERDAKERRECCIATDGGSDGGGTQKRRGEGGEGRKDRKGRDGVEGRSKRKRGLASPRVLAKRL